MRNLLKETRNIIEINGKHENQVLFVTNGEQQTTWQHFTELADFDYDDGYGSEEININLEVVAKDWWLERHEYDGSEWWEFKAQPQPLPNPKPGFEVRETFDFRRL